MKNKIGKLFIVATPIGNLADITLRALDVLKIVDIILCEDTRVTSVLLRHHLIDKPLLVYNDHSDKNTRDKIINYLEEGKKLALVSDAGTPLISDPGYKLIQDLKERNIEIETIPGPCSVIAALTLSGLPTDRFTFIGFLPPKTAAKEKIFTEFLLHQASIICFESANRLIDTLELMEQYFTNRSIVVAREITKLYQEVTDGTASEIIKYYKDNQDKLRGEIVLILSPPGDAVLNIEEQVTERLHKLLKEMSLRDAVDAVASQSSMSKKYVYKLALGIKNL